MDYFTYICGVLMDCDMLRFVYSNDENVMPRSVIASEAWQSITLPPVT